MEPHERASPFKAGLTLFSLPFITPLRIANWCLRAIMNRKMVVLGAVLAAVLVGGVVLATTRGKGMTGLTSILPTIKQQQVAIVKDASNKDTSAFSPNPIQIQPGTTVVWSNNDNTPHTITSGMGLNDTNKGKTFDSSPIAIGNT